MVFKNSGIFVIIRTPFSTNSIDNEIINDNLCLRISPSFLLESRLLGERLQQSTNHDLQKTIAELAVSSMLKHFLAARKQKRGRRERYRQPKLDGTRREIKKRKTISHAERESWPEKTTPTTDIHTPAGGVTVRPIVVAADVLLSRCSHAAAPLTTNKAPVLHRRAATPHNTAALQHFPVPVLQIPIVSLSNAFFILFDSVPAGSTALSSFCFLLLVFFWYFQKRCRVFWLNTRIDS